MAEEDFARWRDDPVTKFIFAAIRRAEAQQREQWMRSSWETGNAHPGLLAELRTRSDAYNALIETSFEGWLEMMETT